MEIKEFVKETLSQLHQGLKEASDATGEKVSLTNVPLLAKAMGDDGLVDFDLAVEAKAAETAKAGGGIKIAVLRADLGKDATATHKCFSDPVHSSRGLLK